MAQVPYSFIKQILVLPDNDAQREYGKWKSTESLPVSASSHPKLSAYKFVNKNKN